jgi:hypothetical protein
LAGPVNLGIAVTPLPRLFLDDRWPENQGMLLTFGESWIKIDIP